MKLRFLVMIALLTSSLFVGAGTASAAVCGTSPQVQVWEDINHGSNTAYACGVGWYRAAFWDWHDNLIWPLSWDDRISSYQTTTFTGHTVRFYTNGSKGGLWLTTTNNEDLTDLRAFNRNDVFSSGWILG